MATSTKPSQSELQTMRPVSCHRAALWALTLFLLVGSATAGPVSADDLQGRSDESGALQLTLPAPSTDALGEGLAASAAAKAASASASDPGASSSALAAEIIKEAGATESIAEPTRKAQRANGQAASTAAPASASPRNQAPAADAEQSLRAMGKAAVDWLKQSVPWLRDDADDGGADKHASLGDATDWSTSALGGGQSGQNAMPGTMQVPTATGQLPSGPGYNEGIGNATAQAMVEDPNQNLIRIIAKYVREVLEHPMTWLVLSLVVVGAIAMKKADRRPK